MERLRSQNTRRIAVKVCHKNVCRNKTVDNGSIKGHANEEQSDGGGGTSVSLIGSHLKTKTLQTPNDYREKEN